MTDENARAILAEPGPPMTTIAHDGAHRRAPTSRKGQIMLRKRFTLLLAAAGLALTAAMAGGTTAASAAGAATLTTGHPAQARHGLPHVSAPRVIHPVSGGTALLSSVNGSCKTWTDGTTFGISCTGMPGWTYYAAALCKNPLTAFGNQYSGTSGRWSYAYCSTFHSTIDTALGGFYQSGAKHGLPHVSGPRVIHPVGRGTALLSSVNGSCKTWTDGTTFGISCTGMPGWLYEAQAVCKDSAGIVGLEYPGTAGIKSYAYCSDYNSSVQTGYGAFSQHNIIIGG